MKKTADEIFSGAKAAVWRDCSCCGDETSHEKSVKRLNAIAKDVMDDRGYPVAEIFDLYGKKDLDDATVDGTHATPEYYHAWTMKIMTGVEAQLKTGCLGDSYEDDEPASCPGLEAVASDGCPADADMRAIQVSAIREAFEECGILLAREAHFPATIANLYKPDAMLENLCAAHERNDETLERIYIGRRFRNDTERLEKLFELYTKMTTKDLKSSNSRMKE